MGALSGSSQRLSFRPDSIYQYKILGKDTSKKTLEVKMIFEYNPNGDIKQSKFYQHNPMLNKTELRYTRLYQYMGNDVIERSYRNEHGKDVMFAVRTFSLNSKKQVKQVLSERAQSLSGKMEMNSRLELAYEKDSLKHLVEFRNSTTIYKAVMEDYQYEKNKLVIQGKEINEIDASILKNYKKTYKLNTNGAAQFCREDIIYPALESSYHGYSSDKLDRLVADTSRVIDEKKKTNSLLSVATWNYNDQSNKAYCTILLSNEAKSKPSKSESNQYWIFYNTSRSNKKGRTPSCLYLDDFIFKP
jgi:hypothetical protein